MDMPPPILAKSEQLVFGLIVVVFWLLSMVATAINKVQEKARREQLRQQLNHPVPPKPLPAPPPPRPVPAMKKKPKTKSPARPAPVMATDEGESIPRKLVASSLSQPAPAVPVTQARKTPTTAAQAIHQWLRPQTLRTQFILTEVLLPPVAMRREVRMMNDE